MKKIEKQVNKLIKEIEEYADKFENLKTKYGVSFVREIEECENSDLKLKLTSILEAPPEYNLDKEMVYIFYHESKDEIDKKYENGEITKEIYEERKSILEKDLIFELGKLELKYSEKEKNKNQRFEENFFLNDKEDYIHSYTAKTTELLFSTFETLREQAKFLISLLEETKQLKFKERIDAIEIEMLQAKKNISVKEFTLIYGFGKQWQNERCRRVRNKLPRFQDKVDGKYMYNVADVEQWFKNENIHS